MHYETYSAAVLGLVFCAAGLVLIGLVALVEYKPARRRRPR
jgi:hypothetical protein